jgi:hypothetical protein
VWRGAISPVGEFLFRNLVRGYLRITNSDEERVPVFGPAGTLPDVIVQVFCSGCVIEPISGYWVNPR